MKPVKWSKPARNDLAAIARFIAQQDPRAAKFISQRAWDAGENLGVRPTGRPSRMAGYYEKSVAKTRLILVYSISETKITILRVMHSAQNWTSDRWPED